LSGHLSRFVPVRRERQTDCRILSNAAARWGQRALPAFPVHGPWGGLGGEGNLSRKDNGFSAQNRCQFALLPDRFAAAADRPATFPLERRAFLDVRQSVSTLDR
jgi:hypothetical protein